MELLKVEFVPGDPSVVQLDGEIDLSTAGELRTALEQALATDPNVVIDMAGVTFVDATGLRVVLQLAACRNGSGPLPLRNASRMQRILELVGLSESPSIEFRSLDDLRGR